VVSLFTAQALRLFRLSAYAGAKYPDSSLVLFVSETNLGDWEDSPAHTLDAAAPQQQAMRFGFVVVALPALAARQDVVCRNRRTPNSPSPQAIEQ
jgi:hypothetical protein